MNLLAGHGPGTKKPQAIWGFVLSFHIQGAISETIWRIRNGIGWRHQFLCRTYL